jgi:ABC-type lipoprotein release transport system permease subunit
MTPDLFRIIVSSVKFFRRPVLYQLLIVALLSAVITGSLLTGSSVRESLKKTAFERLGNTGIVISSGLRYFDATLETEIDTSFENKTSGLLELTGYSQSLGSQKGAFNTQIYGVSNDFFSFHGRDSVIIKQGEVLINRRLADHLELRAGDEIIIRYKSITDIPADAPFAPESEEMKSVVFKIGSVLEPESIGNFSLMISQITPMNVFINLSDLESGSLKQLKINRLIISKDNVTTSTSVFARLQKILKPSHAGLTVRTAEKKGNAELISDRVFIDEPLITEISGIIPSSAPLITYMANSIRAGQKSTPYSFVAALPSSLYPEIVSGNGIIVNSWLAEDLNVNSGDTVTMYWYSPDSLNKLTESNGLFVVRKIVKIEEIWADSLLMPDFPGIAGSESCSDWDAGVPIKMDAIRDKDELYWKRYKGTPKAFISYEKGKELWGNNYGPATAIRFGSGISTTDIEAELAGKLDPSITGFTVTGIRSESELAADNGVDFGTLFLSLGFFMIVASVVLLSFAVSYYFDSKKGIVKTLFALGFTNRWIKNLLFWESSLIGIIGCLLGAMGGYLVNIIITGALNSVWRGAVQTNTLSASLDLIPIVAGFLITILIMGFFIWMKSKRYLKILSRKENSFHKFTSRRLNLILLITSVLCTFTMFGISLLFSSINTISGFATGILLLISFILFWRQIFLGSANYGTENITSEKGLSRLYYSFNPSHAITPILFIAAGIFAVFITSANRMNFDEQLLKRASGTGGYLLWCESNIPVTEDINTLNGKINLGLDEDTLSAMSFTQMKRSSGNDASCLNLNHITAPPLLGADPADFISREAFSFAKLLPDSDQGNPWQYLNENPGANTIYGIADQTVLDWGLKISVGDTLILRAETGQQLNIILAAGLKSSVFQGYVIISKENFNRYFPSVSGSSVMLVDGDPQLADLYKKTLDERLANYGINTGLTTERLKSFYEVTNTYLSVFGVFGALGMILGVAGLGFVLLRNYNQRKREFALMVATGFTLRRIRRNLLNEQVVILSAGIISGVLPALVATLPSLRSDQDIPWLYLSLMVVIIAITGLSAVLISLRSVSGTSLIASLKKE